LFFLYCKFCFTFSFSEKFSKLFIPQKWKRKTLVRGKGEIRTKIIVALEYTFCWEFLLLLPSGKPSCTGPPCTVLFQRMQCLLASSLWDGKPVHEKRNVQGCCFCMVIVS
jgi:hypothetical protein